MRVAIFILSLFSTYISNGQAYSHLIGKEYFKISEIVEIDTLIHIESRININRNICSFYRDSLGKTKFLILEQENRTNDTVYSFTILDIIVIDEFPENGIFIIGSCEFYENENAGFVISIECCYENHDNSWHFKSSNIVKVWSNLKNEERLTALDPKTIIRINEGFYKK